MPISVIQRTRAIGLPLVVDAFVIVLSKARISFGACGGVKSRQTCKCGTPAALPAAGRSDPRTKQVRAYLPGPAPHRKSKIERSQAPRRPQISFSQGAEWKALISRYIGTIPPTGDAAAEQRLSSGPPPVTAASSAMTAKVGAAASDIHFMMPRTTTAPSSSQLTTPVELL
jgi:hypothetical protein